MIASQSLSTDFGARIRYALDNSLPGHARARIIGGNMAATTAADLTAEFDTIRRLRPELRKVVYSCSLRLAPGEHLRERQWANISRDFIRGVGFGGQQFVVIRHADDHVHIVANRIDHRGRAVADGNDRHRAQRVTRELEAHHGLTHAVTAERRAARRRDRDGRDLAKRIGRALDRCDGTVPSLTHELGELGVGVRWNRRGRRMRGGRFWLDGRERGSRRGCEIGGAAWPELDRRLAARNEDLLRELLDRPCAATGVLITFQDAVRAEVVRRCAVPGRATLRDADLAAIDRAGLLAAAAAHPHATVGAWGAAIQEGSLLLRHGRRRHRADAYGDHLEQLIDRIRTMHARLAWFDAEGLRLDAEAQAGREAAATAPQPAAGPTGEHGQASADAEGRPPDARPARGCLEGRGHAAVPEVPPASVASTGRGAPGSDRRLGPPAPARVGVRGYGTDTDRWAEAYAAARARPDPGAADPALAATVHLLAALTSRRVPDARAVARAIVQGIEEAREPDGAGRADALVRRAGAIAAFRRGARQILVGPAAGRAGRLAALADGLAGRIPEARADLERAVADLTARQSATRPSVEPGPRRDGAGRAIRTHSNDRR